MTDFTPWSGLFGGVLIGLAAVILMASHGRIMGASGIIGGMFSADGGPDARWRAVFNLGLLAAAALTLILGLANTETITFQGGYGLTIVSGLIVGAGVALGNGCTSGHGICGLARFSLRSLAATAAFMAVAIATVFVTRHVIGA